MVIWLRHSNLESAGTGTDALLGLGVSGQILPREAVAATVELDAAYQTMQRDRELLLERARGEAAAIIAQAQEAAQQERAAAAQEYASAAGRGYEAGRQQALAEWYLRTAQSLAERRAVQESLRERIAALVVEAVEQIVMQENTSALFARAVTAVDRIVDGGSYLKVRVGLADYDAASQEFGRLAADWRERGKPVPLTVTVDNELGVGGCVCESDIGMIDASLSVQLDAMRAAVARALLRAQEEMMASAAELDAEPAAENAEMAALLPEPQDESLEAGSSAQDVEPAALETEASHA